MSKLNSKHLDRASGGFSFKGVGRGVKKAASRGFSELRGAAKRAWDSNKGSLADSAKHIFVDAAQSGIDHFKDNGVKGSLNAVQDGFKGSLKEERDNFKFKY